MVCIDKIGGKSAIITVILGICPFENDSYV